MSNWKTLPVLALLAACASPAPSNPGGTTPGPVMNSGMPGAVSPRLAVEQFLNAAHAGDLQAMSAVFGTSKGPARETMSVNDLEKREVILQCFFDSDTHRIVGEAAGADGHRIVKAELTKGKVSRQPNFFVVEGPGQRWYVDNMEIAVVRDFCGQATGTSGLML